MPTKKRQILVDGVATVGGELALKKERVIYPHNYHLNTIIKFHNNCYSTME